MMIFFLEKIEWLLRDEQLSTYFTRRSLDSKLIRHVIDHVQSSVNIHKSNCHRRSIDLMFVLGIDTSMKSFLEVTLVLSLSQSLLFRLHLGIAEDPYSWQIPSDPVWILLRSTRASPSRE